MRHLIPIIFSSFLLLFFFSCARPWQHDVKIFLYQCPTSESLEPRYRSLCALLLSLEEREWLVHRVSAEKMIVRAEKCHDRSTDVCAILIFRIAQSGLITAENSAGTGVRGNLLNEFAEWERDLKISYRKFRCRDDGESKDILRQMGVKI